MPRFQAIELEDYDWFPASWRKPCGRANNAASSIFVPAVRGRWLSCKRN